jgi:hypothetical protein
MARSARLAGLDIAEDDAFEQRFSRVQRAGAWAMASLVLAALAGVFGHGPVGRATLAAGGAEVRYERIARVTAPTTLVVRAPAGDGGTLTVALDGNYLERAGLQRVVPEPERIVAGREATSFVFAARGGPLVATFHLKPGAVGWPATRIAIDGKPVGEVRHLVLP